MCFVGLTSDFRRKPLVYALGRNNWISNRRNFCGWVYHFYSECASWLTFNGLCMPKPSKGYIMMYVFHIICEKVLCFYPKRRILSYIHFQSLWKPLFDQINKTPIAIWFMRLDLSSYAGYVHIWVLKCSNLISDHCCWAVVREVVRFNAPTWRFQYLVLCCWNFLVSSYRAKKYCLDTFCLWRFDLLDIPIGLSQT